MKLNVPGPHDSPLACVPNEVQACNQMSRKVIVTGAGEGSRRRQGA
jgi:hypothetical protein